MCQGGVGGQVGFTFDDQKIVSGHHTREYEMLTLVLSDTWFLQVPRLHSSSS